jgi:hypothetical protein
LRAGLRPRGRVGYRCAMAARLPVLPAFARM